MPIIAVINQKGGAGKSTVAVHLARWLQKQRKAVLAIDADAQCSSSKWLARLENKIPYQIIQVPDALLDELPKLANSYDWVIADGPAALSETTRALILTADLVIVPCQPTGVDLESASDTVRLIQQAQRIRRGEPKAVMFVNRAVKGTKLKDEAIEVLKLMPNVAVLEDVLHQRQVIADCYGQNATVFDLSGSTAGIARREIEQLFKKALEVLNA
ncbi:MULTISPECIES: AAA family ATPase [Nostoc]|uniref:AAA family ATPase n=1 Tax=Nostoc paludosum FACHB-159 TaxID=2692908 RepID=A0ABR8KMW7_9NOSO|nr:MULTISPECIES: AAA family ATPase [Nostoc]MBD2683541.1 AAA family ATPase [Nostoc sp. FACHB-857]MBD2739869.1 AAA family ATPase [Nostoc paludosum FACHB-159]